jgi:uncharacterized protein
MAASPPVVVVSGHMVDAPDRRTPRFPADQLPRVTSEIRQALKRWGVGPGTTVVAGGARGADIIVSEQALELGARLHVCLALAADEFERRSVALAGTDWSARFRALLARATVEVVSGAARAPTPSGLVFERANRRILELGRSLAPGTPHALIVWDGQESGERGGTQDFVARLGSIADDRIAVVDPTRRTYERRQLADGPKKLLALDGGGIRGVLSVEVLEMLELQLRECYGPETRLGDYFDYVGGTSAGAIMAAAIALGKTVAEMREAYARLAATVFRRQGMRLRLGTRYRDAPLTAELNRALGEGRTLGDPALLSLLLIVLHNAVTDSAWPLSNCTGATFNQANRLLTRDRNLDLPLTTLVRGSTAAPFFFPPQEIEIGSNRFRFRDGGVTPFTNPALLLALMATLPEYGLGWPTGEDALLVVSIGTGSAPAIQRGGIGGSIDAIVDARNLVSSVMNGASIGQDLVCRALGRTRFGAEIDAEFGSRLNVAGVGATSLFSYVRYDADLSDTGLASLGIRAPQAQQNVRKLDSVEAMDDLRTVGRHLAASVDLETHFSGFL